MCSSFPQHSGGSGAVQILGLGLTPLLIYPKPKEGLMCSVMGFFVNQREELSRGYQLCPEPVGGNKDW